MTTNTFGCWLLEANLRLKDELGSVRIQDFGTRYRVCAFLPGIEEWSPGDTPKTWPEREAWAHTPLDAAWAFEQFAAEAVSEGWRRV